jgi:gluconolactonase
MNLYAPPPIIETQVFVELPGRYRNKGRRTRWAEVNRPGRDIDCFLEGPSFDRKGNLYFVDIPFGRIFRAAPDGTVELVAEYDGEPNGLKIHRDGRLFVTDYKNGLMLLDAATGSVVPYVDRYYTESFKGVNDLIFASSGDLYFTDQGHTGIHDPSGRVFRVTEAGRLECLLNNVPSPNGLALNPAESILYVAVTRANCVWRVPLMGDGGITKAGVFVYLSGGVGPDGMAMDAHGNLAVAHVGMGAVWLFTPKGEPIARVNSCRGDATTNLAYGGPDNRTLYITESESGSILTARLEVAGRPMYSHM